MREEGKDRCRSSCIFLLMSLELETVSQSSVFARGGIFHHARVWICYVNVTACESWPCHMMETI